MSFFFIVHIQIQTDLSLFSSSSFVHFKFQMCHWSSLYYPQNIIVIIIIHCFERSIESIRIIID